MNKSAAFAICLLTVANLFPTYAGASDKGKTSAPEISEYRDVPTQTTVYRDRKAPRECDRSVFLPGQTCWQIYPIAWQSFKKDQKGMNLIVNIWGDNQSGVDFTYAALTIAIDGTVIDLPAMVWNSGTYKLEGRSAVIKDESLVRRISAGHEIWFTAQATPRPSIKLSPKALLSLQAVLEKYDSLERGVTSDSSASSVEGQLEQVTERINEITPKYTELQKRVDSLIEQCPDVLTNEDCLRSAQEIISQTEKMQESIVGLLDRRILLLHAKEQDADSRAAEDEAVQVRANLRAQEEDEFAAASKIKQSMADLKKARHTNSVPTGTNSGADDVKVSPAPNGDFALGRKYESSKDYAVAFAAYKRAGDAGNAEAYLRIAKMYEAGDLGISTSDPTERARQARPWYQKAANAGNLEAQKYLSQ